MLSSQTKICCHIFQDKSWSDVVALVVNSNVVVINNIAVKAIYENGVISFEYNGEFYSITEGDANSTRFGIGAVKVISAVAVVGLTAFGVAKFLASGGEEF